jgi:hypothetical protein
MLRIFPRTWLNVSPSRRRSRRGVTSLGKVDGARCFMGPKPLINCGSAQLMMHLWSPGIGLWCCASLSVVGAACDVLYAPLVALNGEGNGGDSGQDGGRPARCPGPDGARCDGGFCVNGECLAGCWVSDAGGFVPVTQLFDDAGGDGCIGCYPELSDTSFTALAEGTACGGYGSVGVCSTDYGDFSDGCSCHGAGSPCPDVELPYLVYDPDASFVIPCCSGQCVNGICCNNSPFNPGECAYGQSATNCCSGGTCLLIDPRGGGFGYCSWDAGSGGP